MEQKKLKKSTLMKSYLNWSFFHLTSLGFERMEAFGFLHSMLPIIKELYGDDKEEEHTKVWDGFWENHLGKTLLMRYFLNFVWGNNKRIGCGGPGCIAA